MKPIVAFASAHQDSQVCMEAKELLRNAGFELALNETGKKFNSSELKEFIKGAFGVVAGTEKYDADVLAGCTELKAVVRFGVGTDNFDLETMKKMGVKVGVISNNNAVAEFTLLLMMATVKQLVRYDHAVRGGGWDRYRMTELRGKTIGIVGFGRIGKRLAELLSGFGCRILAYARHLDDETAKKYNIILTDFDSLLAQSDIVSLHIPANDSTKHIINRKSIAKMKDGAVLINTARGALVDEESLYEALTSGKLAGAGLDVYEKEPVTSADNPLFSLDNVVLAPHCAALSEETNYNGGLICARSMISVYNGGEPEYPVK